MRIKRTRHGWRKASRIDCFLQDFKAEGLFESLARYFFIETVACLGFLLVGVIAVWFLN